jgi:hypothetical protein
MQLPTNSEVTTMSDQIVAQCMDCGHKEELEDRIAPGTIKCHECDGPVTQYVSRILSPDELAKYGPITPTKGKKPSYMQMTSEEQTRRANIRHQKEAEEQIDQTNSIEELDDLNNNKITKTDYLKLRSMDMTRKEIAKKYGYTQSHLENYWLKQWLIKDPLEEDLAIVEFNNLAKEQPQGLNAINSAHQEEMVRIDPPVQGAKGDAPTLVQEESVKEVPVVIQPEPEAAVPVIAPVPDPVVEESVQSRGVPPEPVTEVEVVPTRKPMVQYEPPAVVKQFTRSITIKTDGPQTNIAEELHAILAYVGAMKGREFQLELYLGEVKVG